MKRIEAVIRPEKIGPLAYFLQSIAYPGLMITKIAGHGRQGGSAQYVRGVPFRHDLLPKLKLEIVVADRDVSKIVKKIKEICHSWKVGEGKIFISNVVNVIRIRTLEQSDEAVR